MGRNLGRGEAGRESRLEEGCRVNDRDDEKEKDEDEDSEYDDAQVDDATGAAAAIASPPRLSQPTRPPCL